jgi:hypothetical protein
VLGVPDCAVPGCDYPVADHGICNGHRLRWRNQGRPALAQFLIDPGPPLRGRSRLSHCTVADCRYGAAGQGLCYRHRKRWERAGRPDPGVWAARSAPIGDSEHTGCRMPFCNLWIEHPRSVFCRSHELRWRRAGSPEVDQFVADCERLGKASIDLRRLASQLRLEFQYVIQSGADTGTARIWPTAVMIAARYAHEAEVTSLLDRSAEQWRRGPAAHRRQTRAGYRVPGLRPGRSRGPARRNRMGQRVFSRYLAAIADPRADPDRRPDP